MLIVYVLILPSLGQQVLLHCNLLTVCFISRCSGEYLPLYRLYISACLCKEHIKQSKLYVLYSLICDTKLNREDTIIVQVILLYTVICDTILNREDTTIVQVILLYTVMCDTILSPSCLEATDSLVSLPVYVCFTVYCRVSQSIHLSPGYGFVDFDAPGAAERAVQALQAQGIQAQMAKVRLVSAPHLWQHC